MNHLSVPVLELSKIEVVDPRHVKAKERNVKRGGTQDSVQRGLERMAEGKFSGPELCVLRCGTADPGQREGGAPRPHTTESHR